MFSIRLDPRTRRSILDIRTPTYKTSLYWLDSHLVTEDRLVRRIKPSEETYALGPHWSFYFGTFKKGEFSLETGQGYLDMSDFNCVFVPSFSVLRVLFGRGIHALRCYVSDRGLPDFMPKYPVALKSPYGKQPSNVGEIVECVATAQSVEPLIVDLYAPGSVRRLKRRLDETYAQEISLTNIAPELLSVSKIRERFRQVYGMTPVAYRNKLRVFSSLWLILKRNFSVTSAGQEVGFHNRAGYIRQFKREVKEVPSAFRIH